MTGGIFNHLWTGHVKAVDNLNEVAGKHQWLGGLEASQQIHPGRLTWKGLEDDFPGEFGYF